MHQRLANALSYNEFKIFYQPVVDLPTGKIVGAEALCRWPQREGTFNPPETFITQAETSGFIVQLGDWVLNTAVEQVRAWQERFQIDFHLAVNLSGRQFLHYNLMKSIEESIRKHRYDARLLEFEITESVAMHNPEATIAVLNGLREMGVELAIDDFGTGYSSLS